jgi:nucleoside-diphosphate-sugar epimerase
MRPILNEDELEDELSLPTPGAIDTLRQLEGDVMLLGAGGKMGPTLARMVRRCLDELGQSHRRVIAVSRFSSTTAIQRLQRHGVETIACDLLDRNAVSQLPRASNVIFMAGQKFGTVEAPEKTWAMNALVPAHVAECLPASRMVVFSTGCVYPLVNADGPGACESDPLGPPGDYSNSCVGRERIFTYFSKRNQTPMVMFRLCYAIDLRYGVLCDVATKVLSGHPIDVSMGVANVIWQGDANSRAIQSLAYADSPPRPLNVTGIERISIRWLADQFGQMFGMHPKIVGQESAKAWIWDASKSYELFGPPRVSLEEMMQATVAWLRLGGTTLGKPTHFEVTDGQF